jgi:hypothetical protein
VGRRDRRELLGVPRRVAGAAARRVVWGIERLEPSEGAGEAARHGVGGRVDDGLGVVLPSDGKMLLQRGDRVEVGGRAESAVGHFHFADPVDPACPPGGSTRATGTAGATGRGVRPPPAGRPR